jgi:hypothetical protein
MLSASAISTLEQLSSKHSQLYERLLATLDIRVQEFISLCSDSANVEGIESSLLNFGSLRMNLCLQNISNLVGPVFTEPQGTPKSASPKRTHKDGDSPSVKSGAITNGHPHPTLAFTSNSDWDKVQQFASLIPKVGSVKG